MQAMNLAIKLPPASRNTDPQTSKESEAQMNSTGQRRTQAESILRIVSEHPGKTAVELTQWVDLDRYQIQRRLSDMWQSGEIRKGRQRKCSIRLTKAVTWWPKREAANAEGQP